MYRLADEWDEHSREALDDVERHVFNPVNYFLMTKHFTVDWEQAMEQHFAPQTTQRTIVLTARRSCASAVLGIAILSVCLSVRLSVCYTRAL